MAITKVTRTLLSTGIDDQSNATAITIDSSENVGIGLTNQANKLQVDGDICIGKATTSADLKSTLKMRGANGSNELQVFDLVNDGENGRVDFKYNRAGGAAQTIMSFGATVGNVGIGTDSPNAKLDILGTTSDQLRLRTSESEDGTVIMYDMEGGPCFNVDAKIRYRHKDYVIEKIQPLKSVHEDLCEVVLHLK